MAADLPAPTENDADKSADVTRDSAAETQQPCCSAASRRGFLTGTAMVGGLVAGYGAFFYTGIRFLFPIRDEQWGWQYLVPVGQLEIGDSIMYESPSGQMVVVTRRADEGKADDFIALSSICPHLGCQVHWEANKSRFFCPCHNGTFDAEGNPTGGPVLKGNMKLTRFELKMEGPLLYVKAPLKSVRQPDEPGAFGPSVGESRQSPTHDTGRA